MRDVLMHLKPFALFALNTGDSQKELKMLQDLFGYNSVKPLVGCYKGETEDSYLVVIPQDPAIGIPRLESILALTRDYGQESILLVSQSRKAKLVFLNLEETKDIGDFIPVARHEAFLQDAWTYDQANCQYWIVK